MSSRTQVNEFRKEISKDKFNLIPNKFTFWIDESSLFLKKEIASP